MSRTSLFYLITLLISLVAVYAEADAHKKEDGPVICYGPRGPRGHRGAIGPRGLTGPAGKPGPDGTDAVALSATMDMIYLWSERSNDFGPVFFQGYQMTTGFTVDPSYSEITITAGGLYLLYFYIRDNMCYTEIKVNGEVVPAVLYDTFQVSGDQLWAQFAFQLNAGDVISFFTYEPIPYNPAEALLPQAVGSVFYSATLQLMIPQDLSGKKA